MLSPAAAFLLAYLPARQVAQLVRGELTSRTSATIDPALKHAVEFMGKALPLELPYVEKANGQLATLGAKAAILVPPPPSRLAEVEAWLRTLSLTVRPLLTTAVLETAWAAGEAARTMQVALWVGAHAAYLRCAAPNNPELRYVAEARARDLNTAVASFESLLLRTGLPRVTHDAGMVARLVSRTPELTPVDAAGYGKLNQLSQTLHDYLMSTARALDVPPPAEATSPPTSAEERLIVDILADPSDDGLRLELADLGEQRGDSRATLIREQFRQLVKEARGETLEAEARRVKARDLVLSHPQWSAPLHELGARNVAYARGFADEITIDADVFLQRGRELFARAPITSLHIREAGARVADLVRSPLLAQIESLDLDDQGVTDDDLAGLAGSEHVRRLRELHLRYNPITARGIEALAASKHLLSLALVSLDGNPADPVDRLAYHDETPQHVIPTPAGQALEAKYGPLRWLHREPPP